MTTTRTPGAGEAPITCPFCGGAWSGHGPTKSTVAGNWIVEWYELYCSDCGAVGPRCETEAAAIAAWNRRTPSSGAGPDEMATTFTGFCPKCGSLPGGEWCDGGTFNTDCCGVELEATLTEDKDGAEHWRFTRVLYECDGCSADVPDGEEHVCVPTETP